MKINKKYISSMATVSMLSLGLYVQVAEAGIINTYTNRGDWESAVGAGNFVTEGFDVTSNTPLSQNIVNDVGEFGVFYTTSGDVYGTNMALLDQSGPVAGWGGFQEDDYMRLRWETVGNPATTALELRFDTPIKAFSANFISDDNVGVTLNLDGTVVNLYNAINGSNGFLGWTLENAVTSLSFSGGAASGNADNIEFDFVSLGNVSAVPVPAAIWLFGSALLGLYGCRKRKVL